MTVTFRDAIKADIPAVLDLLRDDVLGRGRESSDLAPYEAGFVQMQNEGSNTLIIGEKDGEIIAIYQLTFITGLSLRAARRAQIESVRVAGTQRGQKIGEAMIADAETRARAAGCSLLQLTMNAARTDAYRFYERVGFSPSHIGFKKPLID